MTAPKWTPRTVVESQPGGYWRVTVLAETGERVAYAFGKPSDEAEKRARLIASAPALASALEEIEAAVEGWCDGAPDASAASKLANQVTFLARSALAATRGTR